MNGCKRRKLDDGLGLAFEQHRQDHDADARGLAKAGRNGDEIRWHVLEKDALLLDGALTRQTFAEGDGLGEPAAAMRVARKQLELGVLVAAVEMIDRALMSLDQRASSLSSIWPTVLNSRCP